VANEVVPGAHRPFIKKMPIYRHFFDIFPDFRPPYFVAVFALFLPLFFGKTPFLVKNQIWGSKTPVYPPRSRGKGPRGVQNRQKRRFSAFLGLKRPKIDVFPDFPGFGVPGGSKIGKNVENHENRDFRPRNSCLLIKG